MKAKEPKQNSHRTYINTKVNPKKDKLQQTALPIKSREHAFSSISARYYTIKGAIT